jgi:hypothetical protein
LTLVPCNEQLVVTDDFLVRRDRPLCPRVGRGFQAAEPIDLTNQPTVLTNQLTDPTNQPTDLKNNTTCPRRRRVA